MVSVRRGFDNIGLGLDVEDSPTDLLNAVEKP
jgi:hypothetical protein